MEQPYNPLDERNLAEALVRALLQRDCIPLSSLERFKGVGIYALYYQGDFRLYRCLSEANKNGFNVPIYVVKASPPGFRTGLIELDSSPGAELYKRLREHAKSIESARNLRLADFTCRYLITSALWLALGEGLLIKQYRPLWNTVVDGFGDHVPGTNRKQGRRPEWDTLHPGRDRIGDNDLLRELLNYFAKPIVLWRAASAARGTTAATTTGWI